MSNKFYAVKKGRKTGIFYNWDDCKNQIDGFSGSIYKSFKTEKEAREFLGEKQGDGSRALIHKEKPLLFPQLLENEMAAFVDGSYNIKTEIYGFGAVIIYNQSILEFNGTDENNIYKSMRNVAGEIMGAMFSMEYALKNNVKILYIYYDYEGIEKWCNKIWKATKEGTINYKNYYDSIKDKLNVKFIKVEAHTGVYFNELADKLSKNAVGILN